MFSMKSWGTLSSLKTKPAAYSVKVQSMWYKANPSLIAVLPRHIDYVCLLLDNIKLLFSLGASLNTVKALHVEKLKYYDYSVAQFYNYILKLYTFWTTSIL